MHPLFRSHSASHSAYSGTVEHGARFLRALWLRISDIDLQSLLEESATPKRLYSLLLVSFPCALAATLLYAYLCWKSTEKTLAGTRAALMSLYAFITPTQSFWPTQYLSLARSAAASADKTIHVPLATLYEDLLDDVVELRRSQDHLPLLFVNRLLVPARICLDVDFFWRLKLLWWMLCCYMRQYRPVVAIITRHEGANEPLLDNSQLTCSPPPPYPRGAQDPADISAASSPPSTLFFSMLYENAPAVSLDCVPYHALERTVRKLQDALAPGSYLTVGLTTRAGPAARASLLDPKTIITALPFFPRAYLRARPRPNAEEHASANNSERSTTPLLATLPHVLSLLTSGRSPLSVTLVRNVSAEYAVFLRRSVRDLEDDWEIRDAFVREWGVRGWREERVCTAWEAALVDIGWVAGWAVVVRKPE
ncbi:hypothetical protein BV20DRAFT_1119564 [Pilatotrama ljubarskyi]|nr:hypothetical protein BV20DRAFT_1119564 [Pilatotrama ljubarskyi]